MWTTTDARPSQLRYLLFERWVVRTRSPSEVRGNRFFNAFLVWLVDPELPLRLLIITTMRMFYHERFNDVLDETVQALHDTYEPPTTPQDRIAPRTAIFLDISWPTSPESPPAPTPSAGARAGPPRDDAAPPDQEKLPLFLPDSDDSITSANRRWHPRVLRGDADVQSADEQGEDAGEEETS